MLSPWAGRGGLSNSRARALFTSAVYNVVRMGSGFVFVGILPVLARRLDAGQYDVWVLVGQVPGFVGLVASGLSIATIRSVAAAEDSAARSEAVRAGLRYGNVMAVTAGVLVLAFGLVFPAIFDDIPVGLRSAARYGVVLVGAGAVVSLAGTPYWSYFNGVKANAKSSIATAGLRIVGGALVVMVSGLGLIAMFTAYALSLALSAAIQAKLYRGAADGLARLIESLNRCVQKLVQRCGRTWLRFPCGQ
jgi:hypothetical protein